MFQNNNSNFSFYLLFSFGIFGFVALVFQVIFFKNLVLLFGLTAPAAATVLAVYFSGLALGGLMFGKISDRFSFNRLLQAYGGLFILLGIYGLIFPLLFKFLNFFILSVNSVIPLNFAGFNVFAFLFSFLFLIFPSILIGGGFPIINKILVRDQYVIGKKVSLVYFVETLGNVIGALLAGFWLAPSFGNNLTIFIASITSLIVGGVLIFIIRSYYSKSSNNEKSREEVKQSSKTIRNPIFIYALFVTGFLALALEVLYTKTLILFIGSSTYSFSLILITFLLGIALGSWVLSFFVDRIKRGYAYFGLFIGLIGFWLFLTLQLFAEKSFDFVDCYLAAELKLGNVKEIYTFDKE